MSTYSDVELSIDDRWATVLKRCAPLLPLFDEPRLGVSAREAAAVLGLSNANALDRWLVLRKLPRFRALRDGIYIVQLVDRFGGGHSLSQWAFSEGKDPAVFYRFVFRVTRHPWSDVKVRGLDWARRFVVHHWMAGID